MRQKEPFTHRVVSPSRMPPRTPSHLGSVAVLLMLAVFAGVIAEVSQVNGATGIFQANSTATPRPGPTAIKMPFIQGPIEIGRSAKNRPIHAYQVGNGPIKRGLIGAIHGGYERNTFTLMNEMLAYLRRNPQLVPPQITLFIVPLMNPDGNAAGTDRVRGRMNGNGVDLNRNWDYQWNITATHGTRVVSGGTAPFSEPESRAVRDLIEMNKMDAVIFYHSAFDAVFSGAGHSNTKTIELAKYMAEATGYRYRPEGVVGQLTTGDSIDYLTAKAGITAIEIELLTQRSIDWDRNLRGLKAFLVWDLEDVPSGQ